jgi:hypothetical protein
MKNDNTRWHRTTRQLACVAALGMAFMVGAPLAAHAGDVTPPSVPDGLQVPAPNQAFLIGHAIIGSQNYVCLPSPTIGHVDWKLFTPEATLFGEQNEELITHFFSPNPFENNIVRATWQDSHDASTVWARALAASTDPNFVNAGAIPWVLLQVSGARPGLTGGDALSGPTTFIQRVNTVGGAAPSTGCDLPTDIGKTAFVPYTADYVFYKR